MTSETKWPESCEIWQMNEAHGATLTAKSKEDRTKAWDQWASTYDIDVLSNGTVTKAIISELLFSYAGAAGQCLSVLDAACGTGLLGELISKGAAARNAELELFGFDLAPKMIEQAREKNVYRQIFVADVEKELPLPANSFDVFMAAGLSYTQNCGPEGIPNIARCLKPGGLGFISIRRLSWISEEKRYRDAFEKAGLKVVKNVSAGYVGPLEGNYFVLKNMSLGAASPLKSRESSVLPLSSY